jgi:hypothetical protein
VVEVKVVIWCLEAAVERKNWYQPKIEILGERLRSENRDAEDGEERGYQSVAAEPL